MERRQHRDIVRDTGERSDKVTETLERLDVADNLEELRHQIDDLIERLSEKERESRSAARGRAQAPEVSAELEEQIAALGSKVERASDLLAELTDVLEAQNERIETIEQQLGDPDGELAATMEQSAAPEPPAQALPKFSMTERAGGLPDYLDRRLERIEAGIHELERLVVSMANLASSRDRQVRELEERLLILVDTACDVPQRAPEPSEPVPVRHKPASRARETAPAAPAATARRTTARRSRTTDALAAEPPNLERLVEREVHAMRDFRPEVAASVRTRKSRPTVLVVDDAPDALTVLSIYLSKTGFQVVTASSAEDALAKLVHHDVDAIVLDAKMPGADGGHVCRVIAEDDHYSDKRAVPVILYTGYPDEFPASIARDWQLADYVVKGGDMLPLITALVRHTNNMEEVR